MSSSSQQDRKGDSSNKKQKAKKAKGQQNQREKITEEEMQNRMKEIEKRLDEETKRRKAAEKEAKEKDKIIQEKDTLIQDERKRIKLVEKETKEKDKIIQDKDKLLQGTYYATFDEVWGPDPVSFEESDYDAMIRTKFPAYKSTKRSFLDNKLDAYFGTTMEKAILPDLSVARGSRSHATSLVKKSIWPVDVLESKVESRNGSSLFMHAGQDDTSNESMESSEAEAPSGSESGANHDASKSSSGAEATTASESELDSEIAHLVPDASGHASLYYHVAIWVFGGNPPNYEPSVVQKLINGSAKKKRVNNTGLKHMVCNKIRLRGQAEHYDLNPRLIMVPLLSLQQAKKWKGQGYDAIFMISKGSVHESKGTNLQKVASAVQLQNAGGVASQSDIDLARELLTATIKGLAYSFVERSGDEETWVKELKSDSRNALRKLRKKSTVVTGEKKIMVPKHEEQVNEMKPVRKITFSPAFEKVENGHPAPDPLLLAVKAGLNWSAFHEQRLMPARDESDSDMSERSIAAMEEYLAMREHHERARRNKEIMNMTIMIS